MKGTSYVLPFVLLLILCFGVAKKLNVFDCFIEGAKEGIATFVNLLPILTGLVVAVSMLRASGAIELLEKILAPVAKAFGIPEEVIPLCILSPISGSGSLSMYENILAEYGPDSYAGRVASVLSGATETTFYAATVYLGSVQIKKSGTVIPCALIGDIVSFVAAALTVRLFFGSG